MKKYNVYTKETVYSVFYQVEAESEAEAKFNVENDIAKYSHRKDTDSEELVVESVEVSK